MSDQTIPQPIMKPMNNPLSNYFRQPKLYIKLPSHGEFYAEGSLDRSDIDEYAVYAMTAKDELMFKTPDALMNGQATVEVIKSCVPAIKNPWQMPSIDLDAVLIAIRLATYGENLDVSSSCPSCGHLNDYILNLLQYLDTVTNGVQIVTHSKVSISEQLFPHASNQLFTKFANNSPLAPSLGLTVVGTTSSNKY